MGALQVIGWLAFVVSAFGVGVWVGQILARPADPDGATFAQADFPLWAWSDRLARILTQMARFL